MANLFIVGNGFDFQHNVYYKNNNNEKITTSLSDFSKELKKNYPGIFDKIQDSLNKVDKELPWDTLESIRFMEKLTENQRTLFYEQLKCWISKLDANIRRENFEDDCEKLEEFQRLKNNIFDEKTYFINFNYTRTIENLYGYEKNIMHIHGDSRCPILAYSGRFDPQRQIHNQYEINFRKTVDGLREKLGDWLQKKVKETSFVNIYIYGFSFYGKDLDYLRTILDCLKDKGKVIKICDYQAKIIKEGKKPNLKDNIINTVKNYNNFGYEMEIVDFEENSLI